MVIKFYKNNSPSNKIDKDIELVNTVSDGVLFDSSILTPTIKLKNIPTGNYCYIPYLDRYYYVNDVVTGQQCCYVYCSIDVLNTYKGNIYNTSQFVARSETLRDSMLVDTSFNMSADNVLYTTSFGNEIFTNNFTYVLGVI